MIEAKHRQFRLKMVVIEKAQAGFAVIQSLQILNRIPVYGVVPRSSKEARLDSVLPLFESGRVLFPRNAPWLPMLLDELLGVFLRTAPETTALTPWSTRWARLWTA